MSHASEDSSLPAERQPTKNQLLDRAKKMSPEFLKHIAEVLETSVKLKKSMQKRGLRAARSTCPRCGIEGALNGRLAGPKDHIRMWCDTPNCSMVCME